MKTRFNVLLKLTLPLATTSLLVGCKALSPQAQSKQTSEKTAQPILTTQLKAAIEDLRVLKIKVTGGISQKEYGEDLADLTDIVNKAYGDRQTLTVVQSAVKGHQLAIEFWRCDRAVGYDELYQCRDKVLKSVFTQYPDIAAQAKAAVVGENLPYISVGLDKDAVLQAIWAKTAEDTDKALQVYNPPPSPQE